MSTLNRKSILARLLATENITVAVRNTPTAYFDIEARILALPSWTDLTNDLYDLFVGHEVGHALYTNLKDWKAIKRSEVDTYNIVEDIRIEKKMLDRFPGLLGSFKRGYVELVDREFFGSKNIDYNTYGFLDRLNIYAKSRGYVKIYFTSEEDYYVKLANSCETWADVKKAVDEILAWLKTKAVSNAPKPSTGKPSDDTANEPGQSDAMEPSNTEDSDQDETSTRDQDILDKLEASNNSDDNTTSKTMENFRENVLKQLIDENKVTVPAPTLKEANLVTREFRPSHVIQLDDHFTIKGKIIKFARDINTQFNMKRAAIRYKSIKISQKGSINVNKLYNYKVDDNIFNSMTTYPDAKNHGVFILVDHSGSMRRSINAVYAQLSILIEFCEMQKIPYVVYSFTDKNKYAQTDTEEITRSSKVTHNSTYIDIAKIDLAKVISSDMTRFKRNAVRDNLYDAIAYAKTGMYGAMNSTPLNESLLLIYQKMKEFIKNNNIEKHTLIVINDGDADELSLAGVIYDTSKKVELNVDGSDVKIYPNETKMNTRAILKVFKKLGINTVNFFLDRSSEETKIENNKDGYDIKISIDKTILSDPKRNKLIAQKFTDIIC